MFVKKLSELGFYFLTEKSDGLMEIPHFLSSGDQHQEGDSFSVVLPEKRGPQWAVRPADGSRTSLH